MLRWRANEYATHSAHHSARQKDQRCRSSTLHYDARCEQGLTFENLYLALSSAQVLSRAMNWILKFYAQTRSIELSSEWQKKTQKRIIHFAN